MRSSLACVTSPACRRLTWPERQARLNGLASRIDVLTVDQAAAAPLHRHIAVHALSHNTDP